MKQKGFTLIELLAVLAIISILTAITVTTVLKRVKEVEIKVSDQVAEVIYSSARTYINGKIYEYPLINSTSYCIKLKNLLDSGDLRDSFFAGTELTENDYVRVFVSDGKYTYALYNTCTTGTTDVTPPVNVTVTEVSKTTNSITVSTSANDPDSDITKYEFRIDSNSYIDNGTTNTYTFTGVSSGGHTIKIRVTNAFDLSTESTTVTIATDSIGTPTYAINPASGYAQSKVVTISYPTGSGLTYSYNKDGAGYVSAMQTQTVTFTANGYISARVSDGTNMVTASTYNVTGIDNTSPSIPTLASNSATHNSITAVYNASVDSESGINEYVCYYGTTSNPATVGSISGTTCTFNSLSLGVTYYFKICATNGVGLTTCSAVSSDQTEDLTPPSSPTLASSSATYNSITAIYNASTDSESGISSYSCYYGTTASPTTAGSLSGTTCTFSGLNSGTTYYFKMCATNGVSMTTCSTVSNRDTTAGDTTAPSAPTLASSSATFSSITATYNAAVDNESGISSYTCYYGTTSNPSTSSTPSGTTCNFSGLSGGTTYYFKMCATNGVSLTTCSDVSNLPIYTTTTNFAYTGGEQTYVVPASGTYTLTVYGAQGGYLNSSYGLGGKGGYVTGKIYLTAGTVLYVYVGGQGSYTTATSTWAGGGFNGGGTATYYGGGGGGATDIRVGNNTLYHRVVVAGGGGGAQGRASASYIGNGGNGGSYTGSGNDGTYYNGNTTTTYTGKGGSQTAGGAAGVYASYPATAGVFGVGGNAGRYSSTTYRGSGGGGGGWYGGGGGAYRYAGGGGGSGYAWCQMFAGNVPAGYALSSAYYMSDMAGQPGNNSGNGSAIITYYSS